MGAILKHLSRAADKQIDYGMRLRQDAIQPLTRLITAQTQIQTEQLAKLQAADQEMVSIEAALAKMGKKGYSRIERSYTFDHAQYVRWNSGSTARRRNSPADRYWIDTRRYGRYMRRKIASAYWTSRMICAICSFLVVIIGEFNAGKSSFINALLGDNLLPTGITPTTEAIELIHYGDT